MSKSSGHEFQKRETNVTSAPTGYFEDKIAPRIGRF